VFRGYKVGVDENGLGLEERSRITTNRTTFLHLIFGQNPTTDMLLSRFIYCRDEGPDLPGETNRIPPLNEDDGIGELGTDVDVFDDELLLAFTVELPEVPGGGTN